MGVESEEYRSEGAVVTSLFTSIVRHCCFLFSCGERKWDDPNATLGFRRGEARVSIHAFPARSAVLVLRCVRWWGVWAEGELLLRPIWYIGLVFPSRTTRR